MSAKVLEKDDKAGFAGCDPKSVSEDVLKFMKTSFDVAYNNVVQIQNLNEKILKDMIEKGREIEANALEIVNDFIENAKRGQDEYRKVMEDGFKRIEETIK